MIRAVPTSPPSLPSAASRRQAPPAAGAGDRFARSQPPPAEADRWRAAFRTVLGERRVLLEQVPQTVLLDEVSGPGFPIPVLHDASRSTSYLGVQGTGGQGPFLAAVDSRGRPLWTFTGAPMESPPAMGPSGWICFRSADQLHAVTPEGQELWRVPCPGPGHLGPAPAVGGDGTVYAVTPQGLQAARDGRVAWTRPIPWQGHPKEPKVRVHGDAVYVSYQVREGLVIYEDLEILGADGGPRRRLRVPKDSDSRFGAREPASFAVAPDGTLVVQVGRERLAAWDRDGEKLWERRFDPKVSVAACWIAGGPVFDDQGRLSVAFVESGTGATRTRLMGLDRAGAAVWEQALPGTAWTAPRPGPDGSLQVPLLAPPGHPEELATVSAEGVHRQTLVIGESGLHPRLRSVAFGAEGSPLLELWEPAPGDPLRLHRRVVALPPPGIAALPKEEPRPEIRVEPRHVVIGGTRLDRR